MREDNRFKFSNFDEVFGELMSVYRVKRRKSETTIILSAILFVLIFGVITYVASEDIWTLPICVVIPFLMVCSVVWQLFSTRNDELRIYQNGFTYKSAKKLQSCLWEEIQSYRLRERNNQEILELENGIFPLDSVEKKNGEVIDFENDLPGTPEIINRFENRTAKPKPK